MRGKKPTRKQKQIMQGAGLNPLNWLVIGESDGLKVKNKESGRIRVVKG